MRRLNRCTALLLAISGGAGAQAPAPRVIPDEPSCAKCVISTQKVVTLGTEDGVGSLIGKPMSVNVDSRGRYWIFQELEPPTVFSSTGTVIGIVGRKGSGPGEYRSANRGLVIGDSMLVFDWLESRATMVNSELKATRTIITRPDLGHLLLLSWPDVVISAGYTNASQPPNSTLHQITFEGGEPQLTRSFGPRGRGGPMGNVEVSQHIGWARDGFWSIYWNRPLFTHWNRNGQPLTTLTRRYDWFTGDAKASIGSPTVPPSPMSGPIHQDEDGLLWLFIYRPAATWKEGWASARIMRGEVRSRDLNHDRLFDTHVEVIDPAKGRVVTRQTIDGYVFEVLPKRQVALYKVDESGIPRVDIATLVLQGR